MLLTKIKQNLLFVTNLGIIVLQFGCYPLVGDGFLFPQTNFQQNDSDLQLAAVSIIIKTNRYISRSAICSRITDCVCVQRLETISLTSELCVKKQQDDMTDDDAFSFHNWESILCCRTIGGMPSGYGKYFLPLSYSDDWPFRSIMISSIEKPY